MRKVYLLCGDDIYYEEHNFEMLPIFKNKPQDKYETIYNLAINENNEFIVNSVIDAKVILGEEEPVYNQY